ncbi:hypothetical protein AXY43_23170 [Clostridium sp. MF28]|uniref:hypothetical protein n=1 Tax=Clostridium TaxID=1485 RepID=UPI000CF90527|nr:MULTISPECIES: hypothetical protein [Clostridium]AVK50683.1 hypothetical protein AXY43_23170 [Clostridium sp. MF28]PSM58988.1 hypothetical protein C4L39_03780 [Clostridium diolis]
MYYKKIDISNRVSIVLRSWTVYDFISLVCIITTLISSKYNYDIITWMLFIGFLIFQALLRKKLKQVENEGKKENSSYRD